MKKKEYYKFYIIDSNKLMSDEKKTEYLQTSEIILIKAE